jgi:hypothetical protein
LLPFSASSSTMKGLLALASALPSSRFSKPSTRHLLRPQSNHSRWSR